MIANNTDRVIEARRILECWRDQFPRDDHDTLLALGELFNIDMKMPHGCAYLPRQHKRYPQKGSNKGRRSTITG